MSEYRLPGLEAGELEANEKPQHARHEARPARRCQSPPQRPPSRVRSAAVMQLLVPAIQGHGLLSASL